MIDVDSLARYYLMNEYVLNGESFFTSFFWYQDGASDVLHVGPCGTLTPAWATRTKRSPTTTPAAPLC